MDPVEFSKWLAEQLDQHNSNVWGYEVGPVRQITGETKQQVTIEWGEEGPMTRVVID